MEWFMTILDDRVERLRRESARLTADDRRDEGDLAKVQANVYGICKSVYQTLERGNARVKLTELHKSWELSLAAARGHDDLRKAAIETIKLETLDEIIVLLDSGKEM